MLEKQHRKEVAPEMHRVSTIGKHLAPVTRQQARIHLRSCSSAVAEDDGRISTRLENDGQVLVISLDRPKKFNGFTPRMFDELGKAFSLLESSPTVRVGVLNGNGKHFCAGIDMEKVEFDAKLFPIGQVDPMGLYPPLRTKPLICVAHGVSFTVGLELALAADIVIATENTRFAQLEVKRGTMSFFGGIQRLVQRCGHGNAMRYVLTGDEFSGSKAFELGIVQEVYSSVEQANRAALDIAAKIARQAPLAVRESLRSAAIAQDSGVAASINMLAGQVRMLRESKDFAEGVLSFKEKRDAIYKGE